MNNILSRRTIKTDGNWWSVQKRIEEYKSVIFCELFDTMSSAGDWAGAFEQKIGDIYYLIPFSQENNWPRGGFTGYTGRPLVRNAPFTRPEICEIWDNLFTQGFQAG